MTYLQTKILQDLCKIAEIDKIRGFLKVILYKSDHQCSSGGRYDHVVS